MTFNKDCQNREKRKQRLIDLINKPLPKELVNLKVNVINEKSKRLDK